MHRGATIKMWANQQPGGGPPRGGAATQGAPPGRGKAQGKPGKPGKPGKGGRPRKLWVSLLKWAVILGLVGAALVSATVAFTFWMYGRDPKMPQIEKLADYRPSQVVTILDANDRRVGEIYTQRRTLVTYDKIPPIVVDAFVAAEDNHFWTHAGIDYMGMARAFFANLRAGQKKQGASTITQQVVKNLLLTPERTFKRKIQEIILARRLEQSLTKQEIMTLYLNEIYFGAGRYGVEEASLYYFGKSISQVNAGEASVLASLPKEPETLSKALTKNPQRVKDRQIYVLNQLVKIGKLPQPEAQKWIDEPIKIVKNAFPMLGSAPEWVDLVKQELVKLHDGNADALDKKGGVVRTTLDPGLQTSAQKALQTGLRAVDARHKIGRAKRNVGDKVETEIARLARQLPSSGPKAKEVYDAVVVSVHDADNEVVVDLGKWQGSLLLGTREDARFNPPGDDGATKSPSARFKVGDVVEVQLVPGKKAKAADEDDDDESQAKHSKHRVQFAPGPEGAIVIIDVKTRKVRALVGGYAAAGLELQGVRLHGRDR
jgi:penicillin-binding protein 1A